MGNVLSWLDGGLYSPNDQVKKNRLKDHMRRRIEEEINRPRQPRRAPITSNPIETDLI